MTDEMTEEKSGTFLLFWEFVVVFFGFFALMIGVAFTAGRGGMHAADEYDAEEAYILQIEQFDAVEAKVYREYEDYHDFMTRGQPNLIVRVNFKSRGECEVYDPFGEYDTEMLSWTTEDHGKYVPGYGMPVPLSEYQGWAASHISTPYEVEVKEVLLGNTVRAGDVFTFWANYGFIRAGEFFYARYENYPIFRLGTEYILFLSVSDVDGQGRWYDLLNPGSAVEITAEDARTFRTSSALSGKQFGETGNDYENLCTLTERYYNENPYDLSAYPMEPVNGAGAVIE